MTRPPHRRYSSARLARASASAALGWLAILAPAFAQVTPAPGPPAEAPAPAPAAQAPAAAPAAIQLTRADLAASYLAFERIYSVRPPAPERVAEANQAFDQATLAFFAGRQAEAIRGINELAGRLAARGEEPSLPRRIAGSLRIAVEPRISLAAEAEKAMIRVQSLYPVAESSPNEIKFELLARLKGTRTSFSRELYFTGGGGAVVDYARPLVVKDSNPAAGTYDLFLLTPDGQALSAGIWILTSEPFSAQRKKLELRLSAVKAESPELKSAAAVVAARIGLLSDAPSSERSAEFTADPNLLVQEITREIVLLEQGKDPYARRAGDVWHPIFAGEKEIAARVYAPEAARGETPLPLLIALHGAGGDENMFMDGYGAGKIKKLADAKGFVVASPRTETVMQTPEAFDAIVAEMTQDFAIDPARIYIIGHSMGAGAAASLAAKNAPRLAAVVCMAGGRGFDSAPALPPTLVIGGELDPLAQPARLAPPAKAAAEKGLPVEYREIKGVGHTLLVADQLETSVDWLLGHSLKK